MKISLTRKTMNPRGVVAIWERYRFGEKDDVRSELKREQAKPAGDRCHGKEQDLILAICNWPATEADQ